MVVSPYLLLSSVLVLNCCHPGETMHDACIYHSHNLSETNDTGRVAETCGATFIYHTDLGACYTYLVSIIPLLSPD